MQARFRRSGRQAACRLRALPLLLRLLAVPAAGLEDAVARAAR